jgi:hypothetical protein
MKRAKGEIGRSHTVFTMSLKQSRHSVSGGAFAGPPWLAERWWMETWPYYEELMAVPTEVNVPFAFLPSVVMAPMQTTMIRASMTAYSTAVGPSSAFKKWTTEQAKRDHMTGYSFLVKTCQETTFDV